MDTANNGKSHGRCGAKTRTSGEPCKNPALGNGRCRFHGGRAGRPVVHGRYSAAHAAKLTERIEAHREDERPKDLSDEVALLRALLSDLLDRFTRSPNATESDAIGDMVDRIARVAEKWARIDNQTALTAAEVQYLQSRIVDIALKYVPAERREAFASELRGVGRPGGRLALAA